MSFYGNNSLLISNKTGLTPPGSNSVNYNQTANWNGTTTGNVTTVGTNGGPSAYGTYDQTGNINEWNNEIYLVNGIYNRGVWGGSCASNLANIGRVRSFQQQASGGASDLGFRLVSLADPLNYNSGNNMFVNVDDPNNTAFSNGPTSTFPSIGSVSYNYKIMKFIVTNAEYVLFLNSIAKTDPNIAYNTNMNLASRGGITRSGTSGNYVYTAKNNFGNKPASFINWYRAARFSNWLSNDRPSGTQNATTTEDGAYSLSGNSGVPEKNTINPNTGLPPTYSLPSENEWFKAAYYKGGSTNAGYWIYATQSDSAPATVSASTTGNGTL